MQPTSWNLSKAKCDNRRVWFDVLVGPFFPFFLFSFKFYVRSIFFSLFFRFCGCCPRSFFYGTGGSPWKHSASVGFHVYFPSRVYLQTEVGSYIARTWVLSCRHPHFSLRYVLSSPVLFVGTELKFFALPWMGLV